MCPNQGMVFLDKGYDADSVDEEIRKNNCADGTIRKKNRKFKNRDLDKWRSSVRMPYENVFKGQTKIARYRGLLKVRFQCYFEAIVYNFKRLIKVNGDFVPII